jgi:hypothetical protein
MFYIQVDDPAAALEKIKSLGGSTVSKPMEVPDGPTIAHFADPEGTSSGWSRRCRDKHYHCRFASRIQTDLLQDEALPRKAQRQAPIRVSPAAAGAPGDAQRRQASGRGDEWPCAGRYLPEPSRCLHPGQRQRRRWPSSISSWVRRMRRSRGVSCLASSSQQMNSLRAKRGDVLPGIECRGVGSQRLTQGRAQFLHHPTGHSLAAHRPVVVRRQAPLHHPLVGRPSAAHAAGRHVLSRANGPPEDEPADPVCAETAQVAGIASAC